MTRINISDFAPKQVDLKEPTKKKVKNLRKRIQLNGVEEIFEPLDMSSNDQPANLDTSRSVSRDQSNFDRRELMELEIEALKSDISHDIKERAQELKDKKYKPTGGPVSSHVDLPSPVKDQERAALLAQKQKSK